MGVQQTLRRYKKRAVNKVERERYYREVERATGWDRERIKEDWQYAKAALGINRETYMKLKLYELTGEDHDKKAKERLERYESETKETVDRRDCLRVVAEETGWSAKETEERVEEARARLGIPYKVYARYRFFSIPVEEQAAEFERINALLEKKEKARKRRNEAIKETAKALDISYEDATVMVEKARARLGITYQEYRKNGFFFMSEAEQDEEYEKLVLKKEQRRRERAKARVEEKAAAGAAAKPEKPKATRDRKVGDEVEPDAPYGPKISSITDNGIQFYWKKPEHSQGYFIYRGYSPDGPFSQIARIDTRTIGFYDDKDFDHSRKSVWYQVASYLVRSDGSIDVSERTKPKEAVFIEEMQLERETTFLYSGADRKLLAVYGWGEVPDAVWTSSDESVATVSQDGVVHGVARGECTVTCQSSRIGRSVSMKIVVDREAPEPLAPITSRYHLDEETGHWISDKNDGTGKAVIMMVGDMMCTAVQMRKQYSEKEGYNFNDTYEYTRQVTAGSDLAVGNVETLTAAGWPYMVDEGYIDNMNNCNAPARYLDAVKYGGFDLAILSNNHNCDGGPRALMETIDQIDKYKFIRTGVFKNASEKRYVIAEVNGIKVGFLAYMSRHTTFNQKDLSWAQEDKDVFLNVFTPERVKEDVAACRADGAEFVIVYMHWGAKNFRNLTKWQIKESKEVAAAEPDYVVGSNPHVVQEYDVLTSPGGKKIPCAFSVGNYQAVMNQIEGNRDSMLMRIELTRQADGSVALTENAYVPCFAYKKFGGSLWAPVAVSDDFNPGLRKKNMKKIRNRIIEAAGDKIEAL